MFVFLDDVKRQSIFEFELLSVVANFFIFPPPPPPHFDCTGSDHNEWNESIMMERKAGDGMQNASYKLQ